MSLLQTVGQRSGGLLNCGRRGTEARGNEATLHDEEGADAEIEDDPLRLIFTCCHPALPLEGQVALTLREICSLTTEEIARAFLVTPAALAQRIVRAKAVIRDKAIPYQVPVSQELSARLETVLLVVYLILNEGYTAETTGAELSRKAIRVVSYGPNCKSRSGDCCKDSLWRRNQRRSLAVG